MQVFMKKIPLKMANKLNQHAYMYCIFFLEVTIHSCRIRPAQHQPTTGMSRVETQSTVSFLKRPGA